MHAIAAIAKPGNKLDKKYVRQLLSVVSTLSREQQELLASTEFSRARIEVIDAMVAHQNHVLSMLARSGTGEVAPEWSLLDLPVDLQLHQPPTALNVAAPPVHPWAQCNHGYVLYLMRHASNSLVQQAMQMSAADWSTYFINCFTKLVALLELITRYDDEEVAAAATSTGAESGSAWQPAAAASGSTGPAPPGCSLATDLQQLEHIVDEWVLLIVLGLLLNPLAVATATSLNHASGEEMSAPPDHYNRVVPRLQLSSEQGLQFSVALQEFNRLRHAAFHETGILLPDVACPGLMVLAAEAEKGAAALQEITGRIHQSTAASPFLQWQAAPSTVTAVAAKGQHSSQQPAAACLAGSLRNGTAALAKPAGASGTTAGHRNGTTGGAAVSPAVSGNIALSGSSRADSTWGGSSSGGGSCNSNSPRFPANADVLLVRSIQSAPMFAQLLHAINCNILSKFQIAKLVCACFPFIPVPAAVAAAAAQQHQQQQETEHPCVAVSRPRGRPRKHPLASAAAENPAVPHAVSLKDVRFWWQEASSSDIKQVHSSD